MSLRAQATADDKRATAEIELAVKCDFQAREHRGKAERLRKHAAELRAQAQDLEHEVEKLQ